MLYQLEDHCCKEAEDFMCDQVIFSTEVDFQAKRSNLEISTTKLRLAVEIISKTLLPAVSNIYYVYLRNQKVVVDSVRKIIIPTVLAVLANYLSQSLSSVQRVISAPRIEAILNECNQVDDAPEKSVECNVLNSPEEVRVDIIFIHGLHGGLDKTWRQGMWRHERHKINRQELTKSPSLGNVNSKAALKRPLKSQTTYTVRSKILKRSLNQSINNSVVERDCTGLECWPLWLENECPGARVIALNYTTDPHLWRPIWVKKRNRTGMPERSKEMIEQLIRVGVGRHPIVWVGHSKGGLYVKQILIDCSKSADETRYIYDNTKAILFYSVPHRGSIMADVSLPLLSKSIELTEVQKNCKFVLDLHDQFLNLFNDKGFRAEVFSFIETSFTLMSFIYLKIVSFDSADPGIGEICGVPLDHREICKPAGRDCFLYKELVQLIHKTIKVNEHWNESE